MSTVLTRTTGVNNGRAVGSMRRSRRSKRGMLFGLLAWVIGLIFVAPVLWMILTSFHSETSAATNPPSLFAPLTLDGYANFFGASTGASPWPALINSAQASIISTLLVLALS
ncbi:MAG: binding-protein-dependent transport system inner rane component, partial [Microbacteriaceae bacterium]|nr:binding-protein-dependent transport system inner rane component [Microbacteriaceae bacterium]